MSVKHVSSANAHLGQVCEGMPFQASSQSVGQSCSVVVSGDPSVTSDEQFNQNQTLAYALVHYN